MRLWSIHPKYLDSKGLVAAWREGLMAQKCLAGHTKGYNNHPQLIRFKNMSDPITAIGTYLNHIAFEANKRNYHFDSTKILTSDENIKMSVTKGQLEYEWQHFLKKIEARDPSKHEMLVNIRVPEAHPIFEISAGKIEEWEKIS
jgi:hypothetical protein